MTRQRAGQIGHPLCARDETRLIRDQVHAEIEAFGGRATLDAIRAEQLSLREMTSVHQNQLNQFIAGIESTWFGRALLRRR